MAEQAWKSTFVIVPKHPSYEDGDLGVTMFELRDIEGNLHGTYKDYKYAKKQARHKHKKFVRLVENTLLT